MRPQVLDDFFMYCGLRETGVHKKRGGAQNNYEGLTDLYIDDRYSIYNKRLITRIDTEVVRERSGPRVYK